MTARRLPASDWFGDWFGGRRVLLNAIAMHQAVYFTAAQALGDGYSHQSQKYQVDRPKATS